MIASMQSMVLIDAAFGGFTRRLVAFLRSMDLFRAANFRVVASMDRIDAKKSEVNAIHGSHRCGERRHRCVAERWDQAIIGPCFMRK